MIARWIGERQNLVPGIFPNVSRTGNWEDVGKIPAPANTDTTSTAPTASEPAPATSATFPSTRPIAILTPVRITHYNAATSGSRGSRQVEIRAKGNS